MDNTNAISTLNTLIETCKDGEQGFRTAADAVKDQQTKSLFAEYAAQRAEMARELQQEVRTLGGDPERSGSVAGSAHRGWMNIKSAVTRDDASIVAEAERGEDAARKAYEDAFAEGGLPPTTAAVVRRQAERVRAAHDRVRSLEKGGSGR